MLQSIERQSGLPLALDPMTATLRVPPGIRVGRVSTRTAGEMREYIREPDAAAMRDTIYTVYRNVARPDEADAIRAAHLRYDVTVIAPGSFAGKRREFFRTAGHYHAMVPGADLAYPEVFEVLSGRAYWLLQRRAKESGDALVEIYVVEAGPGEKAVMPPGFGHISINVEREPLVMANWINDEFAYEYEPYRRSHGGGYWVLEGDAGAIEFEANSHYGEIPKLRKLRPAEIPVFGLVRSGAMALLARDLGKLDFLSHPERYRDLLALDRCYRP